MTALYGAAIGALVLTHGIGVWAGCMLSVAAGAWLVTIMRGRASPDDAWAKKVFKQSLYLTVILMIVALLNIVLP